MKLYKYCNEDIIYEVDKENKTVTAKVDGIIDMEKLFKTEVLGVIIGFIGAIDSTSSLPPMPKKFEAVARCKDGDIFDEEKGKRVARLKLIKHITKHEYNFLCAVRKKFKEIAERSMQSMTENIQYRGDRIENILGYIGKE